ncbi:MAG TPA: hypothetical protein VFP65_21875 [Anaeromyxobacteraceae bacterium]|nr:hypothetical protein [Anaeromyxobacteraceae bacterium]
MWSFRRAPGALAALALALAAPGAADGPADAGRPSAADLSTVSGKVTATAWDRHEFTVEAADGPVTLAVDRNTTIFLDTQLGSTRDVATGTPVRTAFGKDRVAIWIEVRSRGVIPTRRDAPDAGTPPPALAMPPGAPPTSPGAASTVQASPDAGSGGDRGRPTEVPAGPPPPEPGPGAGPGHDPGTTPLGPTSGPSGQTP